MRPSFKPNLASSFSVMFTACLLAVVVAVPLEAKKTKTKTGCVEARKSGYELLTLSKKGKPKQYALVGPHNFKNDVGHTVRVNGIEGHHTFTVRSVETVAPSCR